VRQPAHVRELLRGGTRPLTSVALRGRRDSLACKLELIEPLDKNKRLMEVVEGKEGAVLKAALEHIPGRENVRWVALDLSDGYRRFARDFFPNAQLVADKFHVLRLVQPTAWPSRPCPSCERSAGRWSTGGRKSSPTSTAASPTPEPRASTARLSS
jgi:Transposase